MQCTRPPWGDLARQSRRPRSGRAPPCPWYHALLGIWGTLSVSSRPWDVRRGGGRGGGAGCAHLPWAATSACSCHASGGPCCPSATALLVSNPPPCRLLVGLAPSRSLAWCARALLIYAGGVSTSGSGRGDSHPSPSLIALAITTLGLRRGLSPTKEVRGSRRSALWRT